MLLTRLPLMDPKILIARLACIRRAASVHPEPRSNSPSVPSCPKAKLVCSVARSHARSPLCCTYHSSVVKVPRQESRCLPQRLPQLEPVRTQSCRRFSIPLLIQRIFECSTTPAFCQALPAPTPAPEALLPWLADSTTAPRSVKHPDEGGGGLYHSRQVLPTCKDSQLKRPQNSRKTTALAIS